MAQLHNLETLEETELRTQAYHTDNAAVFKVLQSYWGKSPAWTNAKKYLKTKDGHQAYRTLYTYFFGKMMTASMQDKILKNLQSYKFDAEHRRHVLCQWLWPRPGAWLPV